jgi:hypothetical protein
MFGVAAAAGIVKLLMMKYGSKAPSGSERAEGDDGSVRYIPVMLYGDPTIHYVGAFNISPLSGRALVASRWQPMTRIGAPVREVTATSSRPAAMILNSTLSQTPSAQALINTYPTSSLSPVRNQAAPHIYAGVPPPFNPWWGGGGGAGGDEAGYQGLGPNDLFEYAPPAYREDVEADEAETSDPGTDEDSDIS